MTKGESPELTDALWGTSSKKKKIKIRKTKNKNWNQIRERHSQKTAGILGSKSILGSEPQLVGLAKELEKMNAKKKKPHRRQWGSRTYLNSDFKHSDFWKISTPKFWLEKPTMIPPLETLLKYDNPFVISKTADPKAAKVYQMTIIFFYTLWNPQSLKRKGFT